MTRPQRELQAAQALIAEGLNDCEIGRRLNIPRGTIRDWRHGKVPNFSHSGGHVGDCPCCEGGAIDAPWYSYLLGLYLGDGWITEMQRGVYKLRIALDLNYIDIIDECAEAMRCMRPDVEMKVGFAHKPGCVEVFAHWKHWICLFPQHGPGRKHLRTIELQPWQGWLVLQHPKSLLRGLIHSDGCRDKNVVNGKSYPRYSFSNNSEDIKRIFCNACDLLGIRWTRPSDKAIAIARRSDVLRLDGFIGPKT